MATFNSMPAMSAAAPNEAMGLNHGGPGQPMAMEHFDQDFNFDEAVLDGGPLPALPFTPAYDFDNFATTFEDPFAYSARAFEPAPNPDALNEESSPQELDNKLLGFSDPIMNTTVVDDTGKFADVNMSAELYGMFFVAEDVFGGDNSGRPLELTCYRRNLWQCSGQITLPKNLSHLMDEQGRQFPVDELSATITAVESIEGKVTEIISIPWKSSNPQAAEETKVAASPPQIPLDLSTAQEVDAIRVTLPVSWKRLQFKHATANNGRRKGLQQHYVVQINLMAKSKSNETMKIAEIQSGPVIVRGRSPRNFDSRKDVPLTGEKRMERKNTASSDNATLKMERENLQATMQRFQSMNSVATPVEWSGNPQPVPQATSQSPHPAKRMAVSPTVARPPVPSWSADGKNMAAGQPHRGSISRQSNAVPINLSLSEDEKSPNRSSAELQSPQMGKAHPVSGQNAGNSPADDPDPLYEYFPLTVDDWMPPIDAVYRPHVVHHTIVPPEIKAQQSQITNFRPAKVADNQGNDAASDEKISWREQQPTDEEKAARDAHIAEVQALYDAGIPFFTKEMIRTVQDQISQSPIPAIIQVPGFDGKIHPRDNTVLYYGTMDGETYTPAISFLTIQYLTDSPPFRRGPEECISVWPGGTSRRYMATVTELPPDEVRSEFDKNFELWEQNKAWTNAQEDIQSYLQILPKTIDKIIGFGLGEISAEYVDRVEDDERGKQRSCAQHALMLTLAKVLEAHTGNPVKCYCQDPAYFSSCKTVLRGRNMEILDGESGFLLVDENSVVISVSPNIPVRQIIADLTRPAMMIWDSFSEPKDRKWERDNDDHHWISPYSTDPCSPRLREMEKEYTKLPFEGGDLFGEVSIYVRKEKTS